MFVLAHVLTISTQGGQIMLRKFFVSAVLSLACLVALTDFAQAQRRGGYRGGGWGGSWGGVGVYIGPSYPRYYDSYRYRTYDPYYSSWWYDTYPRRSYYYQPAVEYVQPATVVTSQANIRVIVADPQARVWFDGAATSQTGTDRYFTTPSLTASGTYRIRASWMQNGNETIQERVVNVSPGQSVIVDFTR
jgi:uncharacterized protein (TIGR03000 family)